MKNFKKVLVAGGTGFVGKAVIRKLEERGINYVTTSRSLGVDFRNFEETKKFFEKEKPDFVINCAAFVGGIKFGLEHQGEIFYNNVLMATNLMEAARLSGVKRFINPISNCAYPAHLSKFKEEDFWSGPLHESVLTYGAVRKLSWVQGWAYNQQYNFDSVHLILPNMYGPGDYFDEVRSHALGALVMKFCEAKKQGKKEVVVWGTGKPVREWLYVDDGAEALVRALEIEPVIEPVNIGRGEGISIKDLAELIKEIVGYQGKIAFDTSKPDGALCKIMVVDKMKKIFNWSPQTTLKEGIQKTVEDYGKRSHQG
jgi:GDP-L-fucose synthase